jgi:ABC-type branched-subunit amino acid transport system substrate-binding protein
MSAKVALGVAVALVTALGGVTACSSSKSSTKDSTSAGSSAAVPSTPLNIQAIAALSGPLAAIGAAQQYGAKAAVAVINANGGVFGKPITYNVTDDTGTAAQTVAVLQSIISASTKPDVVIPGSTSTEISPSVPILAKAGIFTSEHGADSTLNDPTKYPYVFGNVYLPKDQSDNLAAAFIDKGYKSVAVIDNDNARGQSSVASFKSVFSAKGMSVTSVLVPTTSVDATAQVQQAVASKPDVLLIDAFGPGTAGIVSARAKLGVTIPTYGSQGFTAQDLTTLGPASSLQGIKLQALAVGVKGSAPTKTKAFDTFSAALAAQTSKLTFNINNYIVAYNDVILAATAAKLANSNDPAKMQAAVEKMTADQAPLYVGPLGYSATNHYPVTGSEYWVYTNFGPVVNGQLEPTS